MSQEFYDCITEWADRCNALSKENEAIQRERDALKAIVYNAKVLAKEVAEWGMQTEVEEIDLTTAEFGETWWLANKIVAQIEKEEAP
jgi:hypothetical protein